MTEVCIEITHDCALRCTYCSSSAAHPSPLGELGKDEIKSILCGVKELGGNIFSVSGGEPLLHPDILEILDTASKLGFKVVLYTSGVILDKNNKLTSVSKELWCKIKDITNSNIIVIFDLQGCTSQVVDGITAVKGAFPLIEKSIEYALACSLECETHFVPMKPNFESILPLVSYLEEKGIKKMSFLRFVPQGRGKRNADRLLLSPSQFEELQKTFLGMINDCQSDKRNISFRLGHPIDFLFVFDTDKKITSCKFGKDSPIILPNGDVFMCSSWKQFASLKAGNIREATIQHIWNNSEVLKECRALENNTDQITGSCSNCNFIENCKAGCTAQRIMNNLDKEYFPKCMYISPDTYCPCNINS